jgi:F-type H+-transporting ATPase subunit b
METLTGGLQPRDMIALLVTNILAFLVLLWILKRFAWGPLLRMIDARREKIQSDYATAQGKLDEAEQLRGDFEEKLTNIKSLERERVQEAVKRGEEIAQGIENEARGKASEFLGKAEAELDREVTSARLQLRAQVVDMSIAAAEKLIKEKLDDRKHRQLVEDFIQDLGDLRAQ